MLQPVRLQDASGRHWRATYLLQRQDRQWRIGACLVAPDAPRLTA